MACHGYLSNVKSTPAATGVGPALPFAGSEDEELGGKGPLLRDIFLECTWSSRKTSMVEERQTLNAFDLATPRLYFHVRRVTSYSSQGLTP